MNRRNFITNTLATTAAMATSAEVLAQKSTKTILEVIVLATNWGFEGSVDALCAKVKKAGYDGLELWWPTKEADQKELFAALEKYQLKIAFLCGGSGSDFEKHFAQYKKAVNEALATKPLYINSHSGKDYFSFEQNAKIVEFTIDRMEATGIKVLHETHRGRMCYSAPITRSFLEKYTKMKLTLDISHWTNVHESMLGDQKENVELALKHAYNIHARIGHEEGPQVNDPRAPEWRYALDQHLEWWDKVIAFREAEGAKRITFLTEFGPPNYLQTLPFTNQPVANQWDINVHMLNLIKNRYTK
ncbi:sugar phosphate isomerase/epimerase family protein [Lacihabitans soyangensis]|uniref:Twin-arginine translocation signal domain-containing protein n=1 Tax=Lacihabitans soyangensis TaxID=869394 RepID=A0AAE3GYY1_9BACT|nr:TIM barrel protein [Lacihabitans soyangensis]MCP9761763.1 twin-arginine translocation signal domain-containing protein [Lacihabitans soyangensis]